VSPRERLKQAAVALWERARTERSSPRELACSFGLGVFSGCTPAFGFHMWVAIGLASILRLNRLWALLGSRVSFTPLYAWIVFCEIETAHRLRFGTWAPLAWKEAVAHAPQLLGDWLLGVALLGTAAGLVAGCVAYACALRWRGAFIPNTPDAPRLPPSESPPTAPPAPAP
jgi:uncharacterized protein (DUF2062 family)